MMNHIFQPGRRILPLSSHQFSIQTSALDRILRPFTFIDIRMIDSYQMPVSLFIYTLLFVGAAQASLGNRFPGRAGRAMSVGMGIMLSVSLVAMETRLGFSLLKQLGPWALGIVCLLCGIVVFRLLRFAGMTAPSAAAASFISLTLTAFAVVPEFFVRIEKANPFLIGIVSIALLLSVIVLLSRGAQVHGRHNPFEKRLRQLRNAHFGIDRRKVLLKEDEKLLKAQIRPVSRKTVKGCQEILQDLQNIEKTIRKYADVPEARRLILTKIGRILPKEHELRRKIQGLRLMTEQVLRRDSSLLSQGPHERAQGEPHTKEQKILEKELENETGRADIEKRLVELEEGFNRYETEVQDLLIRAAGLLQAGQVEKALAAIHDTIACEKTALEIAEKIEGMEKRLLALVKHDKEMNRALETG